MNTKLAKKLTITFFICFFTQISPCFAIEPINYDTAWTYVYDGEIDSASGDVSIDNFCDVKILPDGSCICAGKTGYSDNSSLLVKLDSFGKEIFKKTYTTNSEIGLNNQSARSVFIAKNGDLILGGMRWWDPWIMRLDSIGNIKWTAWYYDSTKGTSGKHKLSGVGGGINSIKETSRGRIICAIGDEYNGGSSGKVNNYAAYLEYDSSGNFVRCREWDQEDGIKVAGFNIEEVIPSRFILTGNQNVFILDSTGMRLSAKKYSFSLDGVGAVTNRVTRVKKLRDGMLMVIGHAYEEKCWVNYQKYYYDAWWSPITSTGSNTAWYTARGRSLRVDDYLNDMAQLADGRLVFIGTSYASTNGVWMFVTDSTGKDILWNKLYMVNTDKAYYSAKSISVCATSDTGFTIAGNCTFDGNTDAFVTHFKPSPISTITQKHKITKENSMNCNVINSMVTFTFNKTALDKKEVFIFNASGKLVTRLYADINSSSVSFDASRLVKGVYFYSAKSGSVKTKGKFVINK
ncbi:MAG: T9SS type A sorting domain-containing protein [Fibrobacter sp.]|nr:T9SS type A sorting domain-containing protein [Fibrobacter sp.]